jgi:acyl carrier protein
MSFVKTKVRTYIVDNFLMGGEGLSFKDADSFIDKHIVDSTGFLELVCFLEEEWNFAVEDSEMIPENLDSLDNIEAYVSAKTQAHVPLCAA